MKKNFRKLLRQIKDSVIVLFQILSYILFFFFIRPILTVKRTLPKNISTLDHGSLLIANHQAKSDPFIVMGYIPFLSFLKLIPVRFPVDHEYIQKKPLGFFLRFLGCYDVGGTKKERMHMILRTRQMIRSHKTVFLFPEGKLSPNEKAPFQKGIEFLTKEAKAMIFVRIEGFGKKQNRSSTSKSYALSYGEVCNGEYIQMKTDELQHYFDILTESTHPSFLTTGKK